MQKAAEQGLAAALEQLGRYYDIGVWYKIKQWQSLICVKRHRRKFKAQFRLVKLFNQGYGSPRDFEDMYRWLFNAKVADANTHKKFRVY